MRAFLDHLKPLPETEREALCKRAGTTYAYVKKATYVNQLAAPKLCSQIERVTDKKVTRQMLRPDDWAEIWPELAIQEAA